MSSTTAAAIAAKTALSSCPTDGPGRKFSSKFSREHVWYLASLVPLLAIAVAVYAGVHFLTAEPDLVWMRTWAGAEPGEQVANPIKFVTPVRDGDGLLFEAAIEPQSVRAMMTGRVIEAGRGILRINPDARGDQITIVYRGLTNITAKEGTSVKFGDSIGVVEPDGPYPGKVSLRVELEKRSGQIEFPPDCVRPAFAQTEVGSGERLYKAVCSGCHDIRKIGKVIAQGKLISGATAQETTIKTKIRDGGGRMPSFDATVLPDRELAAITTFLLAKGQQP